MPILFNQLPFFLLFYKCISFKRLSVQLPNDSEKSFRETFLTERFCNHTESRDEMGEKAAKRTNVHRFAVF